MTIVSDITSGEKVLIAFGINLNESDYIPKGASILGTKEQDGEKAIAYDLNGEMHAILIEKTILETIDN